MVRFPFQFCSTLMYIGLLAVLIINQRVHKALCAYLCTFAIFAGTAVMIYRDDVYASIVGINIQTMAQGRLWNLPFIYKLCPI